MKRLCNGISINKNVKLEDKLVQLEDIYSHKKLVFDTCYILSKKLIEGGQDELGLELMKRAFLHDFSKLEDDEFYGMAAFANDKDALKDPKKKVSSDKQLAINLHWDRNEHHPEYWTDINQMTDLDIMELVCDWYARSLQFGTDFLEFLEQRQKDRFHFPQDIYDKIKKYYYKLTE
jgi:hypothetical protein